jgi:hypothetical protein
MKTIQPVAPEWLFDQGWTPAHLSVYLYVRMRGKCFEDKRSISARLHMSKNTFFKTQKDLIQTGWLTAEKRGKKSHLAASSTGTCLKSGTRSGNVSQNEDTKQTTCLKIGTVTNSNKDNTVENTVENTVLKAGKDAAWVASYLVGQALRGGAR